MDQWTRRNPELYAKARAFVEAAIHVLSPLANKIQNLPQEMTEKIQIVNENQWNTRSEMSPNWNLFILENAEITELAEFDSLKSFMKSDPVISKHVNNLVGTSHGRTRTTLLTYLSFFLRQQLVEMNQGHEFNIEEFERNYAELEDFFYSDTILSRSICFLTNFYMEGEEIRLSDAKRIRKLSKVELEDLINDQILSLPGINRAFMLSKFIFEMEYSVQKICGTEAPIMSLNFEQVFEDSLGQLISALHLYKQGDVRFNIIAALPAKGRRFSPPGGNSYSSIQHNIWRGEGYRLDRNDINAFQAFFSQFTQVELMERHPVSLALRRFNFAYERPILEDKLIDYVISFEALFFKSGESGELTHKLATRVARLLSQTYEERANINKEMKNIYGIRSKIVHGEASDISSEIVTKTEEFLRKSLKVFLEKMPISNYDELINHLDLD